MTNKLDWTAPLMLDDGKGTAVLNVREAAASSERTVDLPEGTSKRLGIFGGDYGRVFRADGTHVCGTLPRIINRPKPDAEPVEQLPADEPDTVTVPRMTEAEAWELWASPAIGTGTLSGDFVECLRRLDIIKPAAIIPDTPLDRFTASHPNWRDLDKEEAVRLALEQRGEG